MFLSYELVNSFLGKRLAERQAARVSSSSEMTRTRARGMAVVEVEVVVLGGGGRGGVNT